VDDADSEKMGEALGALTALGFDVTARDLPKLFKTDDYGQECVDLYLAPSADSLRFSAYV
jgi:hypothetical protein